MMAWLEALSQWPAAVLLREHVAAYALVNGTHILGIALLIGAIATLDLRVLGLFAGSDLAQMARPLSRVAGVGLGVALVTGFLLFIIRPGAYVENPAFLLKLCLVAMGVLNAGLVHVAGPWRGALSGAPGVGMKCGAVLSLLLWIGALYAGRWIGFLN